MDKEEPLLGLATTEQLLDELAARFEVGGNETLLQQTLDLKRMVPEDVLAYRTVDAR